MEKCPCGSELSYDECCGPVIEGRQRAETAETLMRSRYSAFAKGEIDYIYNTVSPEQKKDFMRDDVTGWSENSEWEGFEILNTSEGGTDDETGTVEFIARFRQDGKLMEHHELARFEKIDDQWLFVDGSAPKPKPVRRENPKIGRNDPCPCGSGKKYKKCCGR